MTNEEYVLDWIRTHQGDIMEVNELTEIDVEDSARWFIANMRALELEEMSTRELALEIRAGINANLKQLNDMYQDHEALRGDLICHFGLEIQE